jgi:hypothetical protein
MKLKLSKSISDNIENNLYWPLIRHLENQTSPQLAYIENMNFKFNMERIYMIEPLLKTGISSILPLI